MSRIATLHTLGGFECVRREDPLTSLRALKLLELQTKQLIVRTHQQIFERRHPGLFEVSGLSFEIGASKTVASTRKPKADDPAKLAEATLWVTIENAKDQTELEFSLNGKPIPRIDQAGKMVYTAFPAGDPNTWRFAFTKAQLPLVKGINQFGVMVHSSRAYEASWVTVKQIDPMVLAAEGAAKPRRRRNRIVRAPGSSFVILRLTCFRVRTN